LANYLVVCMIQRYPLPPSLKRLAAVQLRADGAGAREIGVPGAFDRAARYADAFPKAALREIEAYAGTNRDTVARWKMLGWHRSFWQKRQR
jgi:hypothetical protein